MLALAGDLLVTFSRSGDIAILEYFLRVLVEFRGQGDPTVVRFRNFFQDLSQKAPRGHPLRILMDVGAPFGSKGEPFGLLFTSCD